MFLGALRAVLVHALLTCGDCGCLCGSQGNICSWEFEMVPDTRKTNFSRWVGLLVHSGALWKFLDCVTIILLRLHLEMEDTSEQPCKFQACLYICQ